MKKYVFLLAAMLLFNQGLLVAQTTKIYIVRHAEKNLDNPADRDPALTVEGRERAGSLSAVLDKEKIAAIFSTNYKRTIETATPLAEKQQKSIEKYSPNAAKALAEKIKTAYAGKTVLIVGHSDTILELAEAFGVKRPIKVLTEEDYDNLLLVTLTKDTGRATFQKFGKPHHSGG